MERTSTQRNSTLLVDIENLVGGGANPRPFDIVDFVVQTRRFFSPWVQEFAVSRAYANWADGYLKAVRNQIHAADIEPVQIFRFWGRVDNAADAEMIVDAIELGYERPDLETFILATADGAFVPVVRKLHELGKTVLGVSASTPSEHLVEACDAFGIYASGTVEVVRSKGPSFPAATEA